MRQTLALDEALVSVNKSLIALDALEVYYQIDECFGCPLEKLKVLTDKLEDLVIGTKYKLQIELRKVNNGSKICRFDNLSLDNHGHYKIDVANNKNSSESFNCSIETLEKGDCLWCPIAMLFFFILLITVGEKLYSRFVSTSRAGYSRKTSDIQQQESCSGESSEQQDQAEGSAADEAASGAEAVKSKRVESLDAFRGLTITGMILVNYGGAGYSFLEHKPWDGITLADFVFPFFIFSMGASIAISTRSMFSRGKKFPDILLKILRRSIILLILGLCLNSKWLNGASLTNLRLTGVLQRFSISYLIVAFMYSVEVAFNRWIKTQSLYRAPIVSTLLSVIFELLTAFNYLAVYIYLTFYFHYDPSCPVGYTGPGGQTEGGKYANCTGGSAAWIDKVVLGESHLYRDHEVMQIFKTQVSHDPEGILGYTTSILLTLIGLQCGKILAKFKSHKTRLLMLSQWIAILALACISIIIIPINKRLWSLTFVTLSGACAYLSISLLYLLIDVYNCQRTFFLRLLISAGKNSIFLYVAHSLLNNMLPWHFAVDESSHLQLLIRLSWSTFVWLIVAHYMALKGLFIKI